MIETASASLPGELTDPEFDDFQTVERWAVVGLILAVISPLAMLGTIWWLVPAVAVIVNIVALARLNRDKARFGRKGALVGLALSVFFTVAPLSQLVANYAILAPQARPVADQWFEYLRENSPEKALMLRIAPDARQPFDDNLWTYYRNDGEARDNLKKFVRDPLVRTLLALGPKADVRFYRTAGVATDGDRGVVIYDYSVTYPVDNGKQGSGAKQTFFVTVSVERKPTKRPDVNPWRVYGYAGGTAPD